MSAKTRSAKTSCTHVSIRTPGPVHFGTGVVPGPEKGPGPGGTNDKVLHQLNRPSLAHVHSKVNMRPATTLLKHVPLIKFVGGPHVFSGMFPVFNGY